jgi:Uma2 family endonuclease
VYLPGNPAEDRDTHWFGGPDFAVEVVSAYDHSREKLPFYATVGVRELLLVYRKPWRLELYRLGDGALGLAGTSDLSSPALLTSTVLPLSFRLTAGSPRPRIEATRPQDQRTWIV